MNENKPEVERNPITKDLHRKQVFWQIFFPLILGILGVLTLGVFTILAATGGGSVSQAADASLIFLLIPVMALSIFPLILFAGTAYGIFWLNKNLPVEMYKVQQVLTTIRDRAKAGADRVVEPVLQIRSKLASIQVLRRMNFIKSGDEQKG